MSILHRDGVWWHEAPLPRRLHRCRPHTCGIAGSDWIDRCACGAVRLGGPGHPWLERNSRRKKGRKA